MSVVDRVGRSRVNALSRARSVGRRLNLQMHEDWEREALARASRQLWQVPNSIGHFLLLAFSLARCTFSSAAVRDSIFTAPYDCNHLLRLESAPTRRLRSASKYTAVLPHSSIFRTTAKLSHLLANYSFNETRSGSDFGGNFCYLNRNQLQWFRRHILRSLSFQVEAFRSVCWKRPIFSRFLDARCFCEGLFTQKNPRTPLKKFLKKYK